MDNFKKAQNHDLGIGGIHCYCCNNKARKNRHKKVDKTLNRSARAKMKVEADKEISENE